MPYFPMFRSLEDQTVFVVGGGKVAARKILKLQPFGPIFQVYSPEVSDDIKKHPNVHIVYRKFRPEDLNSNPAMVIAASNDASVNQMVSRICRERHIPVNVVDDPDSCTFLFPALVQQGAFCAGISTGGSSPTAAIYFKEKLQEMLPENLDTLLDWLEKQRIILKQTIPDQAHRAGIFRRMFDDCLEKGRTLTTQECWNCVEGLSTGSVAIVTVEDASDQITLRGLRLLQRCQTLVFEAGVDMFLLNAAPEGAQRIPEAQFQLVKGDFPEALSAGLVDFAKAGSRVVWLKKEGRPLLKETVCLACEEAGFTVMEAGNFQQTKLPGEAKILKDIRIGITGTEQVAGKQRRALEVLGAKTVWIARAKVVELDFSYIWKQMENKYGWLVFTSVNGVTVFWNAMNRGAVSRKVLQGKKVAVIGEATAKAWKQFGVDVDLCPEEFTSEALANALCERVKIEEPIWILRSAEGSKVLTDILQNKGFAVWNIPTYDLAEEEEGDKLPELDYLTFSSASGVKRFFSRYREIPSQIKPVCIGKITAEEFKKHTWRSAYLAKEITVAGLVKTIVQLALSE